MPRPRRETIRFVAPSGFSRITDAATSRLFSPMFCTSVYIVKPTGQAGLSETMAGVTARGRTHLLLVRCAG